MRRDQPSNPTKVPQAHQMTLASELLLEPLGPLCQVALTPGLTPRVGRKRKEDTKHEWV